MATNSCDGYFIRLRAPHTEGDSEPQRRKRWRVQTDCRLGMFTCILMLSLLVSNFEVVIRLVTRVHLKLIIVTK